jgi:sugar lactone lactonase YvrE
LASWRRGVAISLLERGGGRVIALGGGMRSPPFLLLALILPLASCADDGGSTPAPLPLFDPASCEQPQVICTFAGTGKPVFDGDGRARLATSFYWPLDLDFAPDGRAYLLDWQNHRVRRIDFDGRLETVIGNDLVGDGPRDGSDMSPDGAPGIDVELNHPTDLGFLPDGSVVVAAWHNHKVRRLDPVSGRVTVLAGSGPGKTGDGGPARQALLSQPKSVAVDPAGDIYVTDSRNQRIRRIDAASGVITAVVGSGQTGFEGDGADPMLARFHLQQANENPEPGGNIALDAQGRLYVADTFNNRVRRIDFDAGTVETVAGNGMAGFAGDGGPAREAALNLPRDLEIGPDGRLYIADTNNHRIRVVNLEAGTIDTVAGDGKAAFSGEGGPARAASLYRPFGIAFDGQGNLHVADTFNNRIRRIAR